MAIRFTPPDPHFAARVHASFAQQGLMATLGASLELVDPGEVNNSPIKPRDGIKDTTPSPRRGKLETRGCVPKEMT